MAKYMNPLIKSGGFFASRHWTPLVRGNGLTTSGGGEEPEPPVQKTVFGSIVHITDALAAPAVALSTAINPVQDLHGYDNPWPAGGGVNKLDESAYTSLSQITYSNGVFTSVGGNARRTSFAFVRTFLNGSTINTYDFALVSQSDGVRVAFTITFDGSFDSFDVGYKMSSTYNDAARFSANGIANGTYKISFYCDVIPKTDDVLGKFSRIQLELGSSATAWTPYSNICPISGFSAANVTRTGKNIWHGTVINGAVEFETKVGTTYTVSADFVDPTVSTYFYVRKAPIGSETYVTVGYILAGFTRTPITFTAEAGYKYAVWSNASYTNVKNIQIELGSSATAYESYSGTTIPISFGSTVYGGTLDVTAGTLTVDRVMVDLGTLTWGYSSSGGPFFYSPISDIKRPRDWNYVPNWVCTNYKTISGNSVSGGVVGIGGNPNNSQVRICDPKYTDAATFTTAMSGVQLVYELATPTVITLTPTEVQLLAGTNNVWSDTNGDVTLTYLADGDVSDSSALNMLLGGTYTPSADVSDREALQIIMGETT